MSLLTTTAAADPRGEDQAGEDEKSTPMAGPEACGAPPVPAEPIDSPIIVGAGGRLVVPPEEVGDDLDAGSDLDITEMMSKRLRKPNRREWVVLNTATELPTRLLIHKPRPDAIDSQHFYVAPTLRGRIFDELKQVRVFVYYSLATRMHALWVVNVTPENDWYESLAVLFRQSPEFLAANAVRIVSDKANGRYRIKFKPYAEQVAWPTQSTSEMLGEALGPDRFITSADHPIYRDLVDGADLK
ncbi:MAG: hypothetical protein HS116_12345 [Planctomycetes bacterium]|nr:hypothetical protein [Planctomycetota bacterium]